MDSFDDINESEFVTDTDEQDSLDERIDSEQRVRNQQLWASFQTAACCITKLYRDRTQPNVSPWVPFQNAASNLTTLYKDCIESQKRFARIGYQVGRRRRSRELKKLLKKHESQSRTSCSGDKNLPNNALLDSSQSASIELGRQCQQPSAVTSILAVNQLNLGCDEIMNTQHTRSPINSSSVPRHISGQATEQQQHQQQHVDVNSPCPQQPNDINLSSNNNNSISHHNNQQHPSLTAFLGNNDEDLVAFQQALVHPVTKGRSVKMGQNNRRPSINSSTAQANHLVIRSTETSNKEEDRLLELNQFLSEEYYRHVGSRKRSCASIGGNMIKRSRE